MIGQTTIDTAWRSSNPLPDHGEGTDKNARGRVLLVGGSAFVPGALGLTGEAVLRAGAGKLQIATVETAAMHLGVLVPEAAMIGLPTADDGEIAADAASRLEKSCGYCDTLLLGPGMVSEESAEALIRDLGARLGGEQSLVLDAAAIPAARGMGGAFANRPGRTILTPHHGEMARLMDVDIDEVAADPARCAISVARAFGAIVVLKSAETVIADPDGALLRYGSDCVGLATGGSGDVLAGIIAGLVARGAGPLAAAGWGVWLHGEAGRKAAERIGPIGFLARDLIAEIPRLMVDGANRSAAPPRE